MVPVLLGHNAGRYATSVDLYGKDRKYYLDGDTIN